MQPELIIGWLDEIDAGSRRCRDAVDTTTSCCPIRNLKQERERPDAVNINAHNNTRTWSTSPSKRIGKDGDPYGEGTEPHSENNNGGNPFQEELQSRRDDDYGNPEMTLKASPIECSHVIHLPRFPSDSTHSLPLPSSSIADVSSDSTRTRSTSPVKRPDDLLQLQRPVRWNGLNKGDLRAWMGDRNALPLLNKIQASLRKHYIPIQLRKMLEDELDMPDDEDLYYRDNSQSRRPGYNRDHRSRSLFRPFVSDGSDDDGDESSSRLDSFMQLVALESERRDLRDIVTSSIRFVKDPHTEPAWNDAVHHPLLKLAVRDSTDVAVENVTRANIARPFIPPANGYVELSPNGKMIDYALVLRPPEGRSSTATDDDNRNKSLCRRISRFVDQFSPRTFNQSTYSPLCLCPTGVFVETKVELKKHPEGQVQLGIWLASWFLRIELFPPPTQQQGQQRVGAVPSVLPVLIVVADSWELWFASRGETDLEVCGPLDIGSTRNMEECYRLLAALRVLVSWMSSDFREWVEGVV
ncbi:hypothetical protein GQX73_g2845 [Xylaria multiplex]|uniref:PD-(D/E)XK nuclease-like domain-containing protein n=1 Tax=Xylaria multiplex TaxID=323545 RepID=A0A7C8IYG0_9PEZI|nr:hypothetical protein GQX73_g2845 [Xylaria multiplex]